MAGGFIAGVVTFSTNPQRTRALNAVNNYVGNWNAAHPSSTLIGSTTSFTYTYPVDADSPLAGTGQRALSVNYTSSDYATVEAAQNTILFDVNANAYIDIVEMGTGPVY